MEIGEFKARLRILGFEGQILGTDCEVNSKGHKLKSVPAKTGIKFLLVVHIS